MKKKKDKKNLISWIIILLMVSSVFGVIFFGYSDTSNQVKYNGYTFKQNGNIVMTEVDGRKLRLNFFPQDLETLEIPEGVESRLKNSQVIQLMFDPNDANLQYIDLFRVQIMELAIDEMLDMYLVSGVTNQTEVYDLPEISCANATSSQPVLYMYTGNETDISVQGNCMKFKAYDGFDMLRIKDYLLLTFLEVI